MRTRLEGSICKDTRQRGSILIAILGMVTMLSIFAVAVNHQVSQEIVFGRWLMERNVSLSLSKSGVQRMLYELQDNKFSAFDAFNENWGSNEKVFKENMLGAGSFSIVCNGQQGYLMTDKDFRYGACDEAARLSLNKASLDQLKNLLRATLQTDVDEKEISTISESILDWRDDDTTEFPSGAESNYYKSQLNSYEARNANFESVEELLMVRGMTPAIYDKIKPFLTVYTDGRINFNTAPAEVFQALGVSSDLAEKIIAFRRGADQIPGTQDDEVFQFVEGITPAISAAMPFSPEEFAQISNAISAGAVTVKSDVFRIYSIGRLIRGNRMTETRVTAVMDRKGGILYWSEN